MEVYFIVGFVSLVNSHTVMNPAVMDLFKVFAGTTLWIGGLAVYMYRRERKLKVALNK